LKIKHRAQRGGLPEGRSVRGCPGEKNQTGNFELQTRERGGTEPGVQNSFKRPGGRARAKGGRGRRRDHKKKTWMRKEKKVKKGHICRGVCRRCGPTVNTDPGSRMPDARKKGTNQNEGRAT